MELIKIDAKAYEADANKEVRRVLGTNLKRLRESKGMTREDFGKLMGFSRFTVRNFESGEKSPRIPTLVVYADFFDVSLDELFGRSSYTDKVIFQARVKIATEILSAFSNVVNLDGSVKVKVDTPEYSVLDTPTPTLDFTDAQIVKFVYKLLFEAANSKKTFQEVLNDKLNAIFGK